MNKIYATFCDKGRSYQCHANDCQKLSGLQIDLIFRNTNGVARITAIRPAPQLRRAAIKALEARKLSYEGAV